jgi:signal transduction histidine kinase
MGSLIVILFYLNYERELQNLDKELLSSMHLCNYRLNCKEFKVDFVKKEKQQTYRLYKSDHTISSFYPIKDAKDYYLKLFLSYKDYHKQIHHLHRELFIYLLITLSVVFIFSILFSFYALYPLRNALRLTQEFVKDILHDVNTPISTMRLNLSLLQEEIGENNKIKRIERGIENILLLQENLKHYLIQHNKEIESFSLSLLIQERIDMIEKNYPDVYYIIEIPKSVNIESDREVFIRIIDNLLSNASKYNRKDGTVNVVFNEKSKFLKIADTGYGIYNPQRVFERFYTEQKEGVGIGLHIVKKLCEELNIKINISSIPKIGTTVSLKI